MQSISNIEQNQYFSCLEYFELTHPAKFGIKICNDFSDCKLLYLFDNKDFNYNYKTFLNNDKFNLTYINEKYSSLCQTFQNSKDNSYLLQKCFFSPPICQTKEKVIISKNTWYFKNIYNHYFCYCDGYNCEFNQNFDDCKYYFYLSVIDNNKNVYEKTDYLLVDFLYSNRAPGDAYFVFREMIKQNMSAYYLTERKDINNIIIIKVIFKK